MSDYKNLADLIFEIKDVRLPVQVTKIDGAFTGVSFCTPLKIHWLQQLAPTKEEKFFLRSAPSRIQQDNYVWAKLTQKKIKKTENERGNTPAYPLDYNDDYNDDKEFLIDYEGFLIDIDDFLVEKSKPLTLKPINYNLLDKIINQIDSNFSNINKALNEKFKKSFKNLLDETALKKPEISVKLDVTPKNSECLELKLKKIGDSADINFISLFKRELENFYVNDELIKRSFICAFMCSVYNGSLILLEGSVGTGKTTLAKSFPKLVGGHCEVIPVRPAWTDSSDIFGHYDPLSKIFRPERFIEVITDEKFINNNLAMVVFDEMNLARIENYGADLLAQVEKVAEHRQNIEKNKADGEPKLTVWSTEEYNATVRELAHLEQKESRHFEDQRRLDIISTVVKKYPSQIALPQGFVFVGTLNADETTFDISPKVIDRSFVIGFPNANLDDFFDEKNKEIATGDFLDIQQLRNIIHEKVSQPNFGQQQWATFKQEMQCNNVFENFEEYGISLSYRILQDFKVCAAYVEIIGANDSELENTIYLSFLFSRILPRINFMKDDLDDASKEFEEWLDYLQQKGSANNSFSRIVQRLKKQMDDEKYHQVRYWG